MKSNRELELAWDFINNTDRNIFLTGKAGTGKTTFLHRARENSLKRLVVVAPTGVAAINAKGTTIHSLFQMPFGPILPANSGFSKSNAIQRKFGRNKIDIIKSLDLLIIDEISMVRADLLDGIDDVLRRYKDRTKVFGGVQVLMIGDLQQLAPVVKDNEWNLLKPYYETPYFFSSKAFKESDAVGIELRQIFRQQDQSFVEILNEIRDNKISSESIEKLNKRHIPDFNPNDDEGYITLTTHNHQANAINLEKLNEIDSKSVFFDAVVEGDFAEHNFPTHEKLELKENAQVMFVKNDSDPRKRYFNGKIGTIVGLDENKIIVKCKDQKENIEVTTEIWENITYSIDDETKEITEKVKGSFEQIPLKLAWAITVHKSQGLTFDKAVLDVESSFAHGQTYVALSRCKTLDGIVLLKPIMPQNIIHDNTVSSFTKNIEEQQPTSEDLKESEKQYQLNLMWDLFNFAQLHYPINKILQLAYENQKVIKGNYLEPLKTIKEDGIDKLIKVGRTFSKQLHDMSADIDSPQSDVGILERISKGINYFSEQIDEFIEKPLEELSFSTDNKAIKKDLKKHLENFNKLLTVKKFCLHGMEDEFDTQRYLMLKNNSVFAKTKELKAFKTEVKSNKNQKLFDQLSNLRTSISNSEDIPPFQVFTQDALYNMCNELPTTPKQLLKVKGMGKIRVSKYGEEILEIINDYCNAESIEPATTNDDSVETSEKKLHKKGETYQLSFEMYKNGLSIDEIAKERDLKSTTIESHLSRFIADGSLKLSELLGIEKSKEIISAIKSQKYEELSLGELRLKLDEKYSYGELRMALNSLNLK